MTEIREIALFCVQFSQKLRKLNASAAYSYFNGHSVLQKWTEIPIQLGTLIRFYQSELV